jgi:hypothetical protein
LIVLSLLAVSDLWRVRVLSSSTKL